ncbi:MAG: hypothetical protein LBV71_06450 [Prevotella sp.]|jgi:hypothetical protein|nr:hypothetical protein [Prevotella sp.]
MENLKFLQTWSVNDFKNNQQVHEIEIKRNESTGKCFFTYGVETGACSKRVITGEVTMPVISQVCVPMTGEMFFLLHQRGETSGATTLAKL